MPDVKINSKYPWAVNLIKLDRAIAEVGMKDEEVLKAKYISFAGLIRYASKKKREPIPETRLDAPMKEDEEIVTNDELDEMLDEAPVTETEAEEEE